MLELFTEPFEYAFMQKALWAIALASINCGIIGTYVVTRKMAFVGEALTHTLLPGMVIAYLRSIPLFVGALLAGLLTAFGIGLLASWKRVHQDTAIGIVFSLFFAFGVLLMSLVDSFQDFTHILFGSLLGVTNTDLYYIGGLTLCVLLTLTALHKELELSAYDPLYTKLIRIGNNRLRYLLLVVIAFSVVSAVQTIGALLSTALLIIPAATATLIARSLRAIMFYAVGFALIAGVGGLYLSYYYEVATGATIVLTSGILFVIVAWLRRMS